MHCHESRVVRANRPGMAQSWRGRESEEEHEGGKKSGCRHKIKRRNRMKKRMLSNPRRLNRNQDDIPHPSQAGLDFKSELFFGPFLPQSETSFRSRISSLPSLPSRLDATSRRCRQNLDGRMTTPKQRPFWPSASAKRRRSDAPRRKNSASWKKPARPRLQRNRATILNHSMGTLGHRRNDGGYRMTPMPLLVTPMSPRRRDRKSCRRYCGSLCVNGDLAGMLIILRG